MKAIRLLTILLSPMILNLLVAGSAICITPDGDRLYSEHCGSCHNFRAPAEKSDREWDVIMGHMQSVANLTGRQAQSIRDFLQANNNPALPTHSGATVPVDATMLSGRDLFLTKACIGCHTLRGEGGKVGPALDDLFSRRSRDYIIAQINNPKSHNAASVMPPANLAAEDVEKLLRYIETGK